MATLVSSAVILAASAIDVAQRGDTRTVTMIGLAAGLVGVAVSAFTLWKQRRRSPPADGSEPG